MSSEKSVAESENLSVDKKGKNRLAKSKGKSENKKDNSGSDSSALLEQYEQKILELEEQLLKKEKECADTKDIYLRLAAEFDNYRKRTEKEILEIREYAGEKVLREILPIYDDINRALDKSGDNETNILDGLGLIQKKFDKMLSDFGVEPIDALGKEFDPDYHHALMTRPAENTEPDIIIEEFEKGFTYKKHILRYSKVIVSS